MSEIICFFPPNRLVCFSCKEKGHRRLDCPKILKKGPNRFRCEDPRRTRDSFRESKSEKFVYEENCPPPEDEDWGGGDDSE